MRNMTSKFQFTAMFFFSVIVASLMAVGVGCSESSDVTSTSGVTTSTMAAEGDDDVASPVTDPEQNPTATATVTVLPLPEANVGPATPTETPRIETKIEAIVATDETVWVTPTPVQTPAWTIPTVSMVEGSEAGRSESDQPMATPTSIIAASTLVVEKIVEKEVIVQVETVVPTLPVETVVEKVVIVEVVTVGDHFLTATPMPNEEKEFCYWETGVCHTIRAHDPIPISIDCEDKVIVLEEQRDTLEELVGMCAPNISITSDEEFWTLRESDSIGSEAVSLGEAVQAADSAIRITSVNRYETGEDPRCGVVPDDHVCLRAEMEITNIHRFGSTSYKDHWFTVTDTEGTEVQAGPYTFIRRESLRDFYQGTAVLTLGEQISTAVVRYVPNDTHELLLDFGGHGKFSLGSEDHWSVGIDDGHAPFETHRKDILHHKMECGWEFMQVTQISPSDDGSSASSEELARCDPNLVTVPEDELTGLRNEGDTRPPGRIGQLLVGEDFRRQGYSMRVVAVKRHDFDDYCDQPPPVGHVCLGIELEITNFSSDDDVNRYEQWNFEVVGGSRTVYRDGPVRVGLLNYPVGGAQVPPGKRFKTRLVMYVHADEERFAINYKKHRSSPEAIWHTEDPSLFVEESEVATPVPVDIELGAAGTWIGNPAPLGEPVVLHGFDMRILEVERGWQPEEGSVSDVLLFGNSYKYDDNDKLVYRVSRETADERLSSESWDVEEYDGPKEYVRIQFQASNVGDSRTARRFDAADVILVDAERRVYVTGFYPRPPDRLQPTNLSWGGIGNRWRDGHWYRSAELLGGGSVTEELAWLVPQGTEGLTVVWLPDRYEPAAFFALEETQRRSTSGAQTDLSWVDDAIGLNGTWFSRPAPKGRGAKYKDDVAVRVLEVDSLPSSCEWYGELVADRECLVVRLEVAIGPSRSRRSVFDYDDVLFLIDDERISDARRLSDSSSIALLPMFDSVLDWAEINGRGSVEVTYAVEVPAGWREGLLVFYPYANTPEVIFSLTDEEEGAGEQMVQNNVAATVSATTGSSGVGLYEHLNELAFDSQELDDEVSLGVTAIALVCAGYIAHPSSQTEARVLETIDLLVESPIAMAAPTYFEETDDAAVFCGTAFPDNSKPLVLFLLISFAQFGCIFGGQGAFGVTPGSAMEYGEIIFGYWGDDAPASMADFEGPEDFCGWIFDENNEALLELLESVDHSFSPSQ